MLISGTIAAFYPSSFMTEVDALSNYGMLENYKSKDSSNNVKCINENININGENAGNIEASSNGLVPLANSFGNDDRYYGEKYDNKKDKGFDCRINNNNNNNEQRILPSPTPLHPPPTPVDNVCTVWTDSTPNNNDIFFAKSTDGGLTFSEPENISESTGFSDEPQVICEGNNVYVVWFEDTPDTPFISDIFFARSTDGGLTFSEPENISQTTGTSERPQISSEGNNVYMVCMTFLGILATLISSLQEVPMVD